MFKPIIAALLGQHRLQFYETIHWKQACIPFQQNVLTYPPYYHQNFHGIAGGYLNPIATMTYDPVTAFASPPNETLLRRQLIKAIASKFVGFLQVAENISQTCCPSA